MLYKSENGKLVEIEDFIQGPPGGTWDDECTAAGFGPVAQSWGWERAQVEIRRAVKYDAPCRSIIDLEIGDYTETICCATLEDEVATLARLIPLAQPRWEAIVSASPGWTVRGAPVAMWALCGGDWFPIGLVTRESKRGEIRELGLLSGQPTYSHP